MQKKEWQKQKNDNLANSTVVIVIIVAGKYQQWMLKLVEESMLRNKISYLHNLRVHFPCVSFFLTGRNITLLYIIQVLAALNMPANLENSAVATELERSVYVPIPKKGHAKECSNYCTTALISHASKVCSKFSKPGFNSM